MNIQPVGYKTSTDLILVRIHAANMKTFTLILCLTGCVAAALALPATPGIDDAAALDKLDKQWKENKDSIMKRLTEFDANLKKQLAETEGKAKTANGEEKKGLEERIEFLKKEIVKSKLVIDRLKGV